MTRLKVCGFKEVWFRPGLWRCGLNQIFKGCGLWPYLSRCGLHHCERSRDQVVVPGGYKGTVLTLSFPSSDWSAASQDSGGR